MVQKIISAHFPPFLGPKTLLRHQHPFEMVAFPGLAQSWPIGGPTRGLEYPKPAPPGPTMCPGPGGVVWWSNEGAQVAPKKVSKNIIFGDHLEWMSTL